MKTTFLLGAAVIFLAGCANKLGQIDQSKWSAIQTGMSREQVIQTLGAPRGTSARDNVEFLDYVEDRGMLITKGTGIFKHYEVVLTDGKVSSYGAVAPVAPIANGVPVSQSGSPTAPNAKPPRDANRVKIAQFDSVARQPSREIEVQAQSPAKAHKIIALLTAEGSAQDEGDLINAIGYHARKLGADGIVLLPADSPNAGLAIAHPLYQQVNRRVFRANAFVYEQTDQ